MSVVHYTDDDETKRAIASGFSSDKSIYYLDATLNRYLTPSRLLDSVNESVEDGDWRRAAVKLLVNGHDFPSFVLYICVYMVRKIYVADDTGNFFMSCKPSWYFEGQIDQEFFGTASPAVRGLLFGEKPDDERERPFRWEYGAVQFIHSLPGFTYHSEYEP